VVDNPPLPEPQERGGLDIRDKAVETIIRHAAATESIVQRANGMSRLVTDDLPAVSATVHAGAVAATVIVAARWPTPATAFAERIRATVTECVRDQTGLAVTRIDVAVRYLPQSAHHEVRRVQ
jgi:uncharacterized alkaline shock family protein YloU